MSNALRRWIQCEPSGLKAVPKRLTPEMVGGILDVALALSNKCRFTGMVRHHYSVAQHCVLGAELIAEPYRLAFLLHEVSEIYLPDISSPLKPDVYLRTDDGDFMPWAMLEDEHAKAILPALGCEHVYPLLHCGEVKMMDLAMLAAEHEQLQGPAPEPWGLVVPAADVEIRRWTPELARLRFLYAFRNLTGT